MFRNIVFCFLFLFVFVLENNAQAFDFEDDIELITWDLILSEQTLDAKMELISFAKKHLGAPYKYGGATSNGFDCSGFVFFVFNEFGKTLPRSSRDIARIGEKINRQDLQIGDLVFFEGRTRNGVVGHVGIVTNIDNNDVFFIHASTNRNIIVSSMKEEYYAIRFLLARRIMI